MRDRLCTHVHSLTFNHLWDRHWKALRSRYFERALHSASRAIKASLDRGQGGMIGEGKNIWPNVEIHEREFLFVSSVFQLFLTSAQRQNCTKSFFDAALSDPNTPHGREGYYFGASDEYRLYDLAKAYSQSFIRLGQGKEPRADAIYRRGNTEVLRGNYISYYRKN
jgi:hypothetical protein